MLEEVQILPGFHDRIMDRSGLAVRVERPVTTSTAEVHLEFLNTFNSRNESNGVELTKFVHVHRLVKAMFAVHEVQTLTDSLVTQCAPHFAGLATFIPFRFHQGANIV